MISAEPDISIIVVNWNTVELLKGCLQSIYETVEEVSYEIFVVDNGSVDSSVAMVEREFPQVHLIKNRENKGFAAANNQAFRVMKGRYALLLNTDTVLTKGAVKTLFAFLEGNPQAAIACGQLLNPDGTKQNSIAPFPSLLTLMTNVPLLEYLFPRRYPSKRYTYREPIEIESPIGACLLIRKEALEQVGFFDERYFFFFEETDLALRMHAKGYKVYYVPSALIYHFQGQSAGKDFRFRIEFYRSRYYFFRKWKGRYLFYLYATVIFLRLCLNLITAGCLNLLFLGWKKKFKERWLFYARLFVWHLRGCP